MAPKSDVLVDDHVSSKQCKKAVDSLLAHALGHQAKREETELLSGKEQNVWLQVTVKKMHAERKLKPHKIPIKYPIVDPRTTPVCLITKDPQREYKDLLESHGIKFINRIVGITKLKGKFKPFEARRLLLQENGLFLADDRVIPLLPGLLGKKFFEAKKQPIPVCLTRKDLKGELERAISSTYMHQNQGTCTSVKIGVLSHSSAQVLANIQTALPAVVKAVKGGWNNVQSLNIKTNSSVALPIWSCELGESKGARWDGLQAPDSDSDSDDNGQSQIEEDEIRALKKEAAAAGAKHGKRRPLDEAEVTKENPKKRAKTATKKNEVVPEKPEEPSSETLESVISKPRRKSVATTEASLPVPSSLPSASPSSSTPASASTPKLKKGKSAIPAPTGAKLGASAQPRAAAEDGASVGSGSAQAQPVVRRKDRKKAKRASTVPVEEQKPAAPATTPTLSSEEFVSAPKRRDRAKSDNTPTSVDSQRSDLTPSELKAKRDLSGAGHKKEKVLKGKRTSTKDKIVGKRR